MRLFNGAYIVGMTVCDAIREGVCPPYHGQIATLSDGGEDDGGEDDGGEDDGGEDDGGEIPEMVAFDFTIQVESVVTNEQYETAVAESPDMNYDLADGHTWTQNYKITPNPVSNCQSPTEAPVFSASNAHVIIDSDGNASPQHQSTYNSTFTVTWGGISKTTDTYKVGNSGTPATEEPTTAKEGWLLKHCTDAVQNRQTVSLLNATGDTTHYSNYVACQLFTTPVFTTYQSPYDAMPTFVRNSACWIAAAGYPDLTQAMTCLSPWNNDLYEGGSYKAGTLINKRCIVYNAHFSFSDLGRETLGTAYHNWDNPNSEVNIAFADVNGNPVVRTLISQRRFVDGGVYGDMAVGLLDSDVPDTISYAKILPSNYLDYIPFIATGWGGEHPLPVLARMPVVCSDKLKQARIKFLYQMIETEAYVETWTPEPTMWVGISHGVIGDSSSPAFLIINDELVLITTWHYETSGPNYASFATELNAAMADMWTKSGETGDPPTVTTIDLQAFNSI